jgi:hypothetical protein
MIGGTVRVAGDVCLFIFIFILQRLDMCLCNASCQQNGYMCNFVCDLQRQPRQATAQKKEKRKKRKVRTEKKSLIERFT